MLFGRKKPMHFVNFRVIRKDNDEIQDDPSVKRVRLSQQQPLKVSLDECLELFTRDEKVHSFDCFQFISINTHKKYFELLAHLS